MSQLRRIAHNLGLYDIATFSYVVVPLSENKGLNEAVNGLMATENICSNSARILVLQDRFNTSLMQAIGGKLGTSKRERELSQEVYPDRNTTGTYTYSYYSCLYAPSEKRMGRHSFVAQMSPDLAVAF
jgi:hypothetical protein